MRQFIDLHLSPTNEHQKQMIDHALELGFTGIGLTSATSEKKPRIDIIKRLNLTPKNQQDLLTSLKKNRRKYEVISVLCLTKRVARQAAKDHRVDLLRFSNDLTLRRKVWFDRHQAKLTKNSNCGYELSLKELLSENQKTLSKTIIQIGREIYNAEKNNTPIIVSSGAKSVEYMREPRAMVALLSLVELDEDDALDTVSRNPWKMVETNRSKLSDGFVVPGVNRLE